MILVWFHSLKPLAKYTKVAIPISLTDVVHPDLIELLVMDGKYRRLQSNEGLAPPSVHTSKEGRASFLVGEGRVKHDTRSGLYSVENVGCTEELVSLFLPGPSPVLTEP